MRTPHFKLIGLIMVVTARLVAPTAHAAEPSAEVFPYELRPVTDSLVGGAAVLGLASYLIAEAYVGSLSSARIESLEARDVNGFDRFATTQWSPGSATASTILGAIAAVAPVALPWALLSQRKPKPALVLFVMAAEATAFNYALLGIAKVAVRRERPYLYNPDLSLSTKLAQGDDATRSFYSGHSSVAFCGAVFFAKVFSDLYPSSAWKVAAWSFGLALAASTGVLRVTAGKHFPTDVLTGALAGGLVGYAVPELHSRQVSPALSAIVLPSVGGDVGWQIVVSF